MKISSDGFDNTIACSDLELGDIIYFVDENESERLYFVGMINRESEHLFLYNHSEPLFYEPLFDEIVDKNAYKLEKPQI